MTVGSPAAGQALRAVTWSRSTAPVSVQGNHTLRDPDPGITLVPGDRVSLLARTRKHAATTSRRGAGTPARWAGRRCPPRRGLHTGRRDTIGR